MDELHLFAFRLVIVAATVGLSLLAWWGATSTRPRLMRAIVIWVAAMMLVAIRAPGPAIILVMTSAAAWAIVAIAWRWIEPSSAVWRFQLADLCVLLLFAATLAAILRDSRVRLSFGVVATGVVASIPLAPVIAFTHLAVAGRWRWRMAIAAYLAILLAAIAVQAWLPFQTLKLLVLEASSPGNRAFLFLFLPASFSVLAWIAGEAIAGIGRARRSSSGRIPLGWTIALGLATGAGVLLAARYVDEFKSVAEHITYDQLWSLADLTYDQVLILAVLLTTPLLTAVSVASAVWLMNPEKPASSRWRGVARRLALTGAAILAVPAAWLYWQMLWPPVMPPPPPPGSTHYDRILAIARELPEWGTAPSDAVATAAVEELVILLAEPSHLTTKAVEDGMKLGSNSAAMSGHECLKLFELLRKARETAQSGGEYDRVCDLAIAQFHLQQTMSRGGTIGNDGYSVSYILLPFRDKISSTSARRIIDVLERAMSGREDASVKYARSLAQHERHSGWPMRLELVLMERRELPENVRSHYESMDRLAETEFRSLQVFYAVGLFRDQHGRLPATLAEMMPEFLPALPKDPFTDKPMRYVVFGEKYRLYSAGRNGIYDRLLGDDRDFSWWLYQQ